MCNMILPRVQSGVLLPFLVLAFLQPAPLLLIHPFPQQQLLPLPLLLVEDAIGRSVTVADHPDLPCL